MEGWLSTRQANPINPIFIRTKVTQNVFKGNRSILVRVKNERVVMAVGATEVAMGKKKHRTDLSWPIRKGGLQKSFDLRHHR
jgi:hypothetical protein